MARKDVEEPVLVPTIRIATIDLVGTRPYQQSGRHNAPRLVGEDHEAYDLRTWREKMTTEIIDGRPTVVIPAHGMHQALAAAAKYMNRKIPGEKGATWTKKFTSGIMIASNPSLGVSPDEAKMITIQANADGVRGSGKRVQRSFPRFDNWSSTFEAYVMDPVITTAIFEEVMRNAGLFIGIGMFRPEKGGTNGRFAVKSISWSELEM